MPVGQSMVSLSEAILLS